MSKVGIGRQLEAKKGAISVDLDPNVKVKPDILPTADALRVILLIINVCCYRHEELLAIDGMYRNMWAQQQTRAEDATDTEATDDDDNDKSHSQEGATQPGPSHHHHHA